MNSRTEKVIVLYFDEKTHGLMSELWTLSRLWDYMKESYLYGSDPLDLMQITQNEYALGRAEVFGMQNERRKKYGRK